MRGSVHVVVFAVLPMIPMTSLLIVTSLSACTSDYGEGSTNDQDAGASPVMGDRGGKCFPDRQCKTGLVCIDVVCVFLAGDDASSTNDGGGGDAAGVDSSKCNALDIPSPTPDGVRCGPQSCNQGVPCCGDGIGILKCETNPGVCDPDATMNCDDSWDCKPGEVCCVKGDAVTSPTAAGCLFRVKSAACTAASTCVGRITCASTTTPTTPCLCQAINADLGDRPFGILGLCFK